MKEVNKLKKIYEGFFGDDVSEDIAKERRSKCDVCPYNSVNAEKLSLINSIRNTFTAPFCTLCDCQINEKTSSPLEECAMYMINEPKKWFKIKIETMEKKDLDLIQVGKNIYDIQIVDDTFQINLGQVKAGDDTTMELLLQAKEGNKIDLEKMQISCGCTSSKTETVDERTIKSTMRIDINKVGLGSQVKSATMTYKMNGEQRVQKLVFKLYRVS